MKKEDFTFKDGEGVEIFTYKWSPEEGQEIKAVVQIAHGMAETAARYERLAEFLTNEGYMVYANDHRGHGKTAKAVENLGYIGKDGFNWMIEDMKQLNDIIKKENPDKPVFLLGHSMGSMLSQGYITKYGDSIKGVILSGTAGKQGFLLELGVLIAKLEMKNKGEKWQSSLLNKLSFGSYNNSFKPTKTEFDWLSSDEMEVEKYIKDPFCGTVFTSSFFYDFLKGFRYIHQQQNMARIPKKLPIYIFAGDKDPVGNKCKTIKWLIEEYKKLGIEDVEYKFYKDGRHEMLNEVNRDEVMKDLLNWIKRH
ncbi:alpha/beta hydrolase [Fervidicella metallireducens AeB]|uniref:Alpha/beta hydrolase n=1 Tax=Fervidicella metallireducens AeB TaxID=1403537 RepID=A0A017RZN6_9CLOT|nr:alpha/beta hydrolase [Fervidicella metallireducens]EYE89400.1 alpha/beta hydrolase [Fervidicella metallireducens AeB]